MSLVGRLEDLALSDIFQRGVLFMAGENEMAGLGQFGMIFLLLFVKIQLTHLK